MLWWKVVLVWLIASIVIGFLAGQLCSMNSVGDEPFLPSPGGQL